MVLTSFAFLLHRNWSARAGDRMQCMGWSFAAGGLFSKMMLLVQLCVLVGNRLEKDAEQLQQLLWTQLCTQECGAALGFVQTLQYLSAMVGGCSWSLPSSSFTDTKQLHSFCSIIFSLCPSNQFTVPIAAFLILSASSANQDLH